MTTSNIFRYQLVLEDEHGNEYHRAGYEWDGENVTPTSSQPLPVGRWHYYYEYVDEDGEIRREVNENPILEVHP